MNIKMKRPLGRILMDGGFICAKELNLALVPVHSDISDCSGSRKRAIAGAAVIDNSISDAAPGIPVDEGRQSDSLGNSLSNDDRILFVNSDGLTFTVLSGI
ncbi:MAG: hypothetical protein WA946_15470 [Nitrospirota bacterium]